MTQKEALKIAKPILFNTEMVRAILDGRKTVTRRLIRVNYKYKKSHLEYDKVTKILLEVEEDIKDETYGINPDGGHWHRLLNVREIMPPYQVGDILYVRETWCKYSRLEDDLASPIADTEKYYYRADGENPTPFNTFLVQRKGYDEYSDYPLWRPSIHMPKEAARIFLRVTDVSVERLQDITEKQAIAEGVRIGIGGEPYFSCRDAYAPLWNSTVKKSDIDKYGWAANPWVCVIEFKKVEVAE